MEHKEMNSIIWSKWIFFKTKPEKITKTPPAEHFLHFEKRNFLTLILRNFLLYFLKSKLFLIFWETKTPKRIPYNSGK